MNFTFLVINHQKMTAIFHSFHSQIHPLSRHFTPIHIHDMNFTHILALKTAEKQTFVSNFKEKTVWTDEN